MSCPTRKKKPQDDWLGRSTQIGFVQKCDLRKFQACLRLLYNLLPPGSPMQVFFGWRVIRIFVIATFLMNDDDDGGSVGGNDGDLMIGDEGCW